MRKITEMKLFQYKISERISVQLAFSRELFVIYCPNPSSSFMRVKRTVIMINWFYKLSSVYFLQINLENIYEKKKSFKRKKFKKGKWTFALKFILKLHIWRHEIKHWIKNKKTCKKLVFFYFLCSATNNLLLSTISVQRRSKWMKLFQENIR